MMESATAPKDGTVIKIHLDDGTVRRAQWSERIKFWVSVDNPSNQWIMDGCLVGWEPAK